MYKNLKIFKKLLLGFGIVIFLAAIMLLSTLYFLTSVGSLANQMYVGPYVSSTEAMGVRRDLNQLGKDIRSGVLEKDMTKYSASLEQTAESVNARLTKIRAAFGGDMKLVDDLQNAFDALKVQRARVEETALNKSYEEATTIILTDYLAAYQVTADAAEALYGDADLRASNFNKSAQSGVTTAIVTSLALFGVTLVLSVFVTLITTKAIVTPTKQVEAAAKELSSGNLNATIVYEAKDELGSLADSMRHTIGNLRGIISDVDFCLGEMGGGNFTVKSHDTNQYVGDFHSILDSMLHINQNLSNTLYQISLSSDQVSSGAEQVSSGAQALSQGATEQASSVQELAATVTEISRQVNSTAENASLASRKVNAVGMEMAQNNQQMKLMIDAMSEISSSSSEIGKIIKTIEDIAFQTNILALNAAVEAARAGAAGKGFAVVADEVRNLASKSAAASKNTAGLIESSIRAVENGTHIADETAKSLLVTVEGAKEATGIVDNISLASKEQADSILQVTTGIDQISSVVQTNSATAEESAAASEELSGQASMLKDLLGRFQIENNQSDFSLMR